MDATGAFCFLAMGTSVRVLQVSASSDAASGDTGPLRDAAASQVQKVNAARKHPAKKTEAWPQGSTPWARLQTSQMRDGLGRLQVTGSALAALGDHVISDLLAFVQGIQTGALHGGNVHEDVLAAVVRLNEAIALLGVEKLNSTAGHVALLRKRIKACYCSAHHEPSWYPTAFSWRPLFRAVSKARQISNVTMI